MATRCDSCRKRLEVGDWPFCPHGSVLSARAQPFDPVVVFRRPDGSYTFPGRSDEPTPDKATRVELRTLPAVARFEREMNARLKDQHQASAFEHASYYREQKRTLRESLRSQLATMSPRSRRLAEYSMRRSDERESASALAARFDAGFYIQPFHTDQSNRPDWRDVDTGWKGRRG